MFVEWIIKNKDILALALSLIGIFVQAFLTYYIYKQTKRTQEWQLDFEQAFQDDQLKNQKRQIKIDAFPYKREIYKSVYSVFQFCMLFIETAVKVKLDFTNMDSDNIIGYFETLEKNAMLDRGKVLWNLSETRYVLPNDISKVIIEIKELFDVVIAAYISLGTFVSTTYIKNEEYKKYCNEFVNRITENCKLILSKADFIEKVLPEEIKITE